MHQPTSQGQDSLETVQGQVKSTSNRNDSIPNLSQSQDQDIGYLEPVQTEQPMHGHVERNQIQSTRSLTI